MAESAEPRTMREFYDQRADAHEEMASNSVNEFDRRLHRKVAQNFRELACERPENPAS